MSLLLLKCGRPDATSLEPIHEAMPSAEKLIQKALKKAPDGGVNRDKLEDKVVAALVEAGKSAKKAKKLFAARSSSLPVFVLNIWIASEISGVWGLGRVEFL